ncbi:MAG: cytochrome c oxidase subunit 3 [Acetobacteraceae bacterium]
MAEGTLQYPGMTLGKEPVAEHDESENLMFGFWFFLMSDALLFALVFSTYLLHVHATFGGPGPRALYDMPSVFVETMVLLASSFTFGMASLTLKYEHGTRRLFGWLLVTLLLGMAFIGLEVHDFLTMIAIGGFAARNAFLSGFWDLVPLHGLHVTIACIWLLCLAAQVRRHGLDGWSKLGIRRLALFWHFLDIVWIAIFSIVYLAGVA